MPKIIVLNIQQPEQDQSTRTIIALKPLCLQKSDDDDNRPIT